jgi:hypothetical protein
MSPVLCVWGELVAGVAGVAAGTAALVVAPDGSPAAVVVAVVVSVFVVVPVVVSVLVVVPVVVSVLVVVVVAVVVEVVVAGADVALPGSDVVPLAAGLSREVPPTPGAEEVEDVPEEAREADPDAAEEGRATLVGSVREPAGEVRDEDSTEPPWEHETKATAATATATQDMPRPRPVRVWATGRADMVLLLTVVVTGMSAADRAPSFGTLASTTAGSPRPQGAVNRSSMPDRAE